ncbi:MAG TPA: tRNA(His) guanylyltransferase Thg1 family protein [Polyangia bacterium]|jgi:tRNA(His) 5'-end guanylyltransferase
MAEHLGHFEAPSDHLLGTGSWPLCRLRGHDLETLLASSQHEFKQPFDPRFGKMMVKAASHVLSLPDIDGLYGFAEHGEVSLLVRRCTAERSARELLVRVVAEASAKLSVLLGAVATYDAVVYEFPNPQLVENYYRWRQHEAVAQALDGYCTHVLTRSGGEADGMLKILDGLGVDEKLEILRQNEIDYAELPLWQRRGTGIIVRANGEGADGVARLMVDTNLPEEEAYAAYLRPLFA